MSSAPDDLPASSVTGVERWRDGRVRHEATVSIRRALAPFAVAGPVLCGCVLLGVELSSGASPSAAGLVLQVLGVLLVIAVNLCASRQIGLRLVRTQAALTEEVQARQTAERELRQAVRGLTDTEDRLLAQQQELTRRNRDLDALGRASSAVLTGVKARQAVVQAAASISDALAVLLFEPDAAGRQLVAREITGLDLPEMSTLVGGSGLAATTYRSAKTQVIPDILTHQASDHGLLHRFLAAPGGDALRSAICVPVVHESRTRAVLVVLLRDPVATGDTRVLALLELLAADAALALSREDLLTELARQAVTDPLTGLANRRRWDEELGRESARATRSARSLSVVVLDLDHFKAYNDRFGHPAGDDLLQETTRAWQRLLRAEDLLARIGGEEFAVLLPDCGAPQAARVADGLLRAVPRGQTCSAGVAQLHGDTLDQLFSRADQALYEAKNGGRACVRTAPPTPSVAGATLHLLVKPERAAGAE